MKMFLRNISLLVFLFIATTIQGQTKIGEGIYEKNAHFRVSDKDTMVTISYYEVLDTQALRELAAKKPKASSFPLIFVKKSVFNPFTDLVQQYEVQLDSLYALDKHNQALDGIQQRKITEMLRIDTLKELRIKNYEHLTTELWRTNDTLNKRLQETLDMKSGSNKAGLRKQLWTGILGGTVGFSLATIFFVLTR